MLIVLAALAPGLGAGALIGAVAWRLAIGERWWAGVCLGGVAGAVLWFAWLRYG